MRTPTAILLVPLLLPAFASAQTTRSVEADRARIRAHLSGVEAELRGADVSHLSDEQRAARAAALDLLGEYWRAGVFPRNEEVPGRNPVFIDDEGRACAVGHLLVETGHADVARRIAGEQNLERVPTIDDRALGPWLETYGLTVEEATRIQPSYCFCGFEEAPVCGADGVTYENACTATECRGVDVAADGECSPGDEIVRDCACDGPEEESGGCAVLAPRRPAPGAPAAILGVALVASWLRRKTR